MKKFLLVIILLMPFAVHAQSAFKRLHFEAAACTGIKQEGITPLDFSFKAHLDVVQRMYLFVSAETNLSCYNHNDIKTYFKGESLGGGLGFKLYNRSTNGHAIDVRAKVLSSIGNIDWKRTSYDASLSYYINNGSYKFSPIIELGYRYIHSRTSTLPNYSNAYITFGIRY